MSLSYVAQKALWLKANDLKRKSEDLSFLLEEYQEGMNCNNFYNQSQF